MWRAALAWLLGPDDKPQIVASAAREYHGAPWVDELRKMIGKHEVRDNKELRAWLKSDGKTLGDPAVLPWCGDAVMTALANTVPNLKLTPALQENPYWARNWAKFGFAAASMPYGAIVALTRPGGGGHVGFAVGRSKDGRTVYILGGNQSDSVSIAPVKADRILGVRWPHDVNIGRKALPIMSGGAVSVNEA